MAMQALSAIPGLKSQRSIHSGVRPSDVHYSKDRANGVRRITDILAEA